MQKNQFSIKPIKNSLDNDWLSSFWQKFESTSKEKFLNYLDEQLCKKCLIAALIEIDTNQPIAYAVVELRHIFSGEVEALILDFRTCHQVNCSESKEEKWSANLDMLARWCVDLAKIHAAVSISSQIATADKSLQALFSSEKFTIHSFNFFKRL